MNPMNYTPQKLIDTGRYKTCFSELPSAVQQEVLVRHAKGEQWQRHTSI